MRKMLRGKIHRATVTGADLHYEGSVTIDSTLMEAAGLIENEAVQIWDVDNGERFETYAICGQPGSGVVCVNGAAAHKVDVGDLVIIAAFGWMEDEQARQWKPKIVFVERERLQLRPQQHREVVTSAPRAGAMAATESPSENLIGCQSRQLVEIGTVPPMESGRISMDSELVEPQPRVFGLAINTRVTFVCQDSDR